jgi:RNA polymerase sigma-70 factor, ECF subfamily
MSGALDAHAARFEPERGRLLGLAYRMLGSLAEAEDVVQDAFVRFQAVELAEVSDVPSYMSKTVARLCLDRLKSARARRETYVGTWLPEPVVAEEPAPRADHSLELADDLSFALLLTLERLSPPERTAFLLHDVFGMEFDEVAQVLERSSAACRKLAERAREQVHAGRARFEATPEDETRLLTAFLRASIEGDVEGLQQLLAADAVLYSDGGGKRRAALRPLRGPDKIARFITGIKRTSDWQEPSAVVPRRVNQLPGLLIRYDSGDLAVAAIELRDGLIAGIYLMNNPDKLRHLQDA